MSKKGTAALRLDKQKSSTGLAYSTRVNLPDAARGSMVALLNQRLADAIDLHAQSKQAHWNIKGPRFQTLHELFDATAALATTWTDDIAERAVQLGGVAEGTVQVVAERTSLSSAPMRADDADTWVRVVADALGTFTNAARAGIDAADTAGDQVTADLLTGIAGAADKQLWFVETHLQGR